MTLNLSQFKGGGGSVPGDLRLFISGSGAPALTLQGQDWLQTGFLTAYDSSKHARLLSKFPGFGVKALPAAKATSPNYSVFNTVFKINTYYVRVSSNAGVTNQDSQQYSTDLISWTGCTGVNDIYTVRGVASVNGYTIAAVYNNTGMGFFSTNSGNAWAAMSGGSSDQTGLCIASNGTIAIGLYQGRSTVSTDIKESSNGTTFVDRTGSGGSNFSVRGLHYSPCASAFLYLGDTQVNKAANGYTQTACTLPAGVTLYDDGIGMQQVCASSPSATIILMADGRLLRTADGSTFTIESFLDVFGEANVTTMRMLWDGARFVVGVARAGSAKPAFLYSTTGLSGSWQRSYAFDDLALSVIAAPDMLGLAFVDSKLLWLGSSGLYDVTGMPQAAAPDYVGSYRRQTDGPANYYVRVK